MTPQEATGKTQDAARPASGLEALAEAARGMGAEQRAEVLTQALPWIKALTGTTVVVKYGGAAMVDPDLRARVMEDIMLLHLVGVNIIVVHGGGKSITRLAEQLGVPAEFRDGLRVTTPELMHVVTMVLCGQVNQELVLALNAHGPLAVGLSGTDGAMVFCCLVGGQYGRVGTVELVDPDPISTLLGAGYIPVIASVGVGPDGMAVNVNADTFAAAVAQTCGASKVVFLTDVDGIYRDFSDKSSLIGRMTADDARELLAGGTLSQGMIPKLKAALDALSNGVGRAHILNGTLPHSIILELLTDTGIGTMITGTSQDLYRHDVAARVSRESRG